MGAILSRFHIEAGTKPTAAEANIYKGKKVFQIFIHNKFDSCFFNHHIVRLRLIQSHAQSRSASACPGRINPDRFPQIRNQFFLGRIRQSNFHANAPPLIIYLYPLLV